jgi:hypothetical protein
MVNEISHIHSKMTIAIYWLLNVVGDSDISDQINAYHRIRINLMRSNLIRGCPKGHGRVYDYYSGSKLE